MIQETNSGICCAGNAKGYANNAIGRYCVPAKNWGKMWKEQLNFSQGQSIFVASGPGGDFAIQNSGFQSGTQPSSCPEDEDVLTDLLHGFFTEYGTDWKMSNGNSFALYG
jgi:hypothetical protein